MSNFLTYQDRVEFALTEIPAADRICLILLWWNLPPALIGQVTGRSTEQVRGSIARAVDRLVDRVGAG